MVSQINASVKLVSTAKFIVMFVMATVMTVTLAAPTSYAQQAPEPVDPQAPSVITPSACRVAPPEVFVSGIQFVPNAPTNNPALQWNWTFTPPQPAEVPEEPTEEPAEEPYVLQGYSYAIYVGETLQSQGVLTADATTLAYAASADATYTLYLWADEGQSEPIYCAAADIAFDATPPVITNSGYSLNGNVGAPLLTTGEVGLTYSWAVDGLNTGVEISELSALNPTFTFLRDGTYTFTLTAADAYGNSTEVLMTITYTYVPPFAPLPGDLPLITEKSMPAPLEEFTPITEKKSVAANTYSVSDDFQLPPAVEASVYTPAASGADTIAAPEKEVAGAVAATRDGWRILGVNWYWWVLIAAIIASAWLWVLRTYRSLHSPDDM